MDLEKAKEYLIERAKETSTWQGVVLAATAAGAHLSEDARELIMMGGVGLAGLLAAVLPDKKV